MANPLIDLTGKRFGKLTVRRRYVDSRANTRTRWLSLCDCGKETISDGTKLRGGQTRSCGCLTPERNARLKTTHGHSIGGKVSRTYEVWQGMIKRCTNPKTDSWQYYGARGIDVCKRWLTFANFLKDMGERPPNLSIDRINTNGNYKPSNCRWASSSEQARNRRKRSSISIPKRRDSVAPPT